MGVLALKIPRIWLLILATVAVVAPVAAQDGNTAKQETGVVLGTVTDTYGDTLVGATVTLQGSGLSNAGQAVSNDNGFFEFNQLEPGTYRVIITAPEFADWTSPDLALSAGQSLIVSDIHLHIAKATTTVDVTNTAEEVATQEVKIEETQRVFGVIPNFYVVYDPHPVALTTKLKFQLAMKTSTDLVTIAGVGVLAGINQAGGTPAYAGGIRGYSERFGAAAADGFSDIMIGGAILPSLLHQDPRYYYQGTGTNKSRLLHAISAPFLCKGDNGHVQPNYSSMGGDLASSALSNAYYPPSDRGARLMVQNFLLSTSERMLSTVVQEFVLGKVAKRGAKD
jgi:hypothetical protein